MAKVTPSADFGKITSPEEFVRFAGQFLRELSPVINGKIEFDLNILSQTKVVFFPDANVNLAISHNLNKTNVSYLVCSKTATCDVYNGTSNTNSVVNLKSTVAGVTIGLVLF